MPIIERSTHGEGATTRGGLHVAVADYRFADDGGAVGDIALTGSTFIPSGAVITGGYLRVTTAPTSGGAATIAVKVEGAGDIVAAAAISGAPWSSTGFKDIVPDSTGSTAVVTTAARDITATVATAALTAGAFRVVLFYVY